MEAILITAVGTVIVAFGIALLRPSVMRRWLEYGKNQNPLREFLRAFGVDVDRNEKVELWFARHVVPFFLIVVGLMIVLAGASML